MKHSLMKGSKAFTIFNVTFLIIVSLFCLMPFINLLAVSFSGKVAVGSGSVTFWPVDFTLSSYEYILNNNRFLRSSLVSLERVILGVTINLFLTVLLAYPLSKDKKQFKTRSLYAWIFILTMLLNGGLIPWYMTIKLTGLIDTIWALIIPGAVPVFNTIVLLNFFRGLPKELEEAAYIDGAGHWTILWKLYIPISKPALATITLFCIVNHWNSWFDGLILMNKQEHYPLQSYLQTVIINPENFLRTTAGKGDLQRILNLVSARTSKAAQLFVSMIPVLTVYPFLQKYFTTGLVLGSVKG